MGLRDLRRAGVPFHQQVADAVVGQEDGGGQAAPAPAHDQNRDLDCSHARPFQKTKGHYLFTLAAASLVPVKDGWIPAAGFSARNSVNVSASPEREQ
ncbi:hypothetical protein GCM10009736_36130 [Actinomadura bangladeshensis]